MPDIRHRVRIAAPPERVYQDLTTKDGFARWWTRADGQEGTGGKLEFFFGAPEPAAVMEVTELVPSHHVAWRCVQGPDEWVGTSVIFDLKPADDETAVVFSHAGWREPVEGMYHCSTKWASFLLSLKQFVETGQGRPAPDDVRISDWH